MRTPCQTYAFAIFLLLGFLFFENVYGQSSADNLNVRVENSLIVGNGGSLFIDGNLRCEDITFTSDGQVTVYSSAVSDIELPSKIPGSGVLALYGTGNFEVTSPEGFWTTNLAVNTTGNVYLYNDFVVKQKLSLLNGIVDVASPYALWVESNDVDAVLFDNTDYNKSYVIGYLGRNVDETGTYYYPIGESSGAYPVFLTGPDNPDVLLAKYDRSISSDARTAITTDKIFTESGWHVYSDSYSQNSFKIGVWVPEQFNASSYVGIIQSQLADFSDYNKAWDCNNPLQSYLAGAGNISTGYLALFQEDESAEIELRNFFLVGNGNTTLFEIPDASKYSNIGFTLYNRLGQRIFYARPYENQLDLAKFPTGTYYYELILEEKNTAPKKVYNFIEVKNENY